MGGKATKILSDIDAGESGERIFEERSLAHSLVAASAVFFCRLWLFIAFADILIGTWNCHRIFTFYIHVSFIFYIIIFFYFYYIIYIYYYYYLHFFIFVFKYFL